MGIIVAKVLKLKNKGQQSLIEEKNNFIKKPLGKINWTKLSLKKNNLIKTILRKN